MNALRISVSETLTDDLTRLCQWDVIEKAYLGTMAHPDADLDDETGLVEVDGKYGTDEFRTSLKVRWPLVRSRPTTQALRLLGGRDRLIFRSRAIQIKPDDLRSDDFVVREVSPSTFSGNEKVIHVSDEWFDGPLFATQRVAGKLAIYGKHEHGNPPEIAHIESSRIIDPEEGLELMSKLSKKLLDLSAT